MRCNNFSFRNSDKAGAPRTISTNMSPIMIGGIFIRFRLSETIFVDDQSANGVACATRHDVAPVKLTCVLTYASIDSITTPLWNSDFYGFSRYASALIKPNQGVIITTYVPYISHWFITTGKPIFGLPVKLFLPQ